ncbi:MAG: hypothetical protein A3G30_03305 [Chlamydiae bacterium RIFCSPLOWO2_12_FULL_49_12]|nr:MAG: hypothetical protein A3G30_03305 [Chlamydiae bacterium RIFCSPLOWO2_12_FULL_49_12]HCJ82947.1 hypothetical protein [Parachlamydiales bacterium]
MDITVLTQLKLLAPKERVEALKTLMNIEGNKVAKTANRLIQELAKEHQSLSRELAIKNSWKRQVSMLDGGMSASAAQTSDLALSTFSS